MIVGDETSESTAHHTDQADAGIEVAGLSKTFLDDHGHEVAAVDDVSLTVPAGEFLVLLGPSGCGKTTLLRCLAGLETPETGSIVLAGRKVAGFGRKSDVADRRVGMVFQSYALWPHMTVAQNIAYPLTNAPKGQRLDKAAMQARVRELLALMRLDDHAERKPSQLSGGQQQRVALARAIASGNDLVLFDEPLSNIDAKVREKLRAELRLMQRRLGFTAVYVTHDQTEALELADRIAVMRDGRIVQLATAEEVYREPRTRYVADFVGTSNLIEVRTGAGDRSGLPMFETALGPMAVSSVKADPESPAVVTSRAHAWWIRAGRPSSDQNCWQGKVVSTSYLGWYTEFLIDIDGVQIRIWDDHGSSARDLHEGAEVWVGVSPENCVVVTDD